MCTNMRYIYNRHIKKDVLVECGKCPACQQKKAIARANRIRHNSSDGNICLFVTLTYDNKFVPYIDTRELNKPLLASKNVRSARTFDVPIRRHSYGRYVRTGSSYLQQFHCEKFSMDGYQIDVLPYFDFFNTDMKASSDTYLRPLTGRPANEIGIVYYPDVQLFLKRFRQILHRQYHYEKSFKYFACSEYGGKFKRPHHHLLIYCPPNFESVFRDAICTAWPYARDFVTRKGIEIARDCAGYVSSYVNCSNSLSRSLTSPYTKQKHAYSQGFGLGISEFSLRSILDKIDRGRLVFRTKKMFEGHATDVVIPLPAYSLNRFFPKFKGYSRLDVSTLYELLRCPERLYDSDFRANEFNGTNGEVPYTLKDVESICSVINNAYKRVNAVVPMSRIDYARYHVKCWTVRASNILRLSLEDRKDFRSFYDNLCYLISYDDCSVSLPLSLENMLSDMHYSLDEVQLDPNKHLDRVNQTLQLTDLYYKLDKQKKVSDYCMNAINPVLDFVLPI